MFSSMNDITKVLPLSRQLNIPPGYSEKDLFNFITSVCVSDAPKEEMYNYGSHDFKRFVYTWEMVKGLSGKCLELGANPYFTTMLLKKFTDLDLSLANYFGPVENGVYSQTVKYTDLETNSEKEETFSYRHFNVETDNFPYTDSEFDVIIFAEIIEHLQNDPCKVLSEIKRVLKPGGVLVVTTPNVARLENISRLINGSNIYDPYSGYGAYGRHNREYNQHELVELLKYMDFKPSEHFTSDVHFNNANHFYDVKKFRHLLKFRENDLGQYLFVKAVLLDKKITTKKPKWLYRSYPENELET